MMGRDRGGQREAAAVPTHHLVVEVDRFPERLSLEPPSSSRAYRIGVFVEACRQVIVRGGEAFTVVENTHQLISPLAPSHDLIRRRIPAGHTGDQRSDARNAQEASRIGCEDAYAQGVRS